MKEPSDNSDNKFAAALRKGLRDAGMSQLQLAKRQGIRGHDTVGRYARGERIPSRRRQWELLIALDLPSYYQVEPRKVSRRTPAPTVAVQKAKQQTPRERLVALIPMMTDAGIEAVASAMAWWQKIPEFWSTHQDI